MFSRAKRKIDIVLNSMTGSVFYLKRREENVISIYIGESDICSYFYVSMDCGISFWDNITFDDLNKHRMLNIRLLRNVFPSKIHCLCSDIQDDDSHKNETYKSLDCFNDITIICIDGEMKSNRFLLSQRSKFFLVYFTKYNKDNSMNLNYKRDILNVYIRYLILNQSDDRIRSQITELIEFGNFIQDFEFVKFVYNKIWNELSPEEKSDLNDVMMDYFSI